MSQSAPRLCVLLAAVGFAAPAAGEDTDSVPRYRLKVGQELTYRQTSDGTRPALGPARLAGPTPARCDL